MNPLYIKDFAAVCALGADKKSIWDALKNGIPPQFIQKEYCGKKRYVAEIPQSKLPHTADSFYDNHVNRLSEKALVSLESSVAEWIQKWGAHRIGVFLGSSDNGSESSLSA